MRRQADVTAGTVLVILPALLYPLAAARQGVFYVGDIFRLFYPQRAVYADALRLGHLPLWTPNVLSGFPLLAEGQTGVFYPLNLLLYRFLPIDVALNYSILVALSLAGAGTYALGRVLRLRPAAAFLAGLVFAYSGFFVGHFNHLNILAAAPWLPVELAIAGKILDGRAPARLFLDKAKRSDRWSSVAWAAVLSAIIGVQFLAGHPQIWLMSMLVVLAFGLFRALWPADGSRESITAAVRVYAPVPATIAVGLALAAVQLLPTWELVGQSVRAGGLSADLVASFSWHPALLGTLLVPFALGNPYPNVSVELAGYLGLLPLMLALVGLGLRRDRLGAFLAVMAGVSLVLAFGHYAPVYPWLARLPVLNLFRVPARFLYPFTLTVALLAGRGLDAFLSRGAEGQRGRGAEGQGSRGAEGRRGGEERRSLALIAGGVGLGAVGIRLVSLDTLLALRWVLPAITFVLAGGLLILAWRRKVGHRTLAWAAIGLTLIDLYAYAAVYRLTYNNLMPPDEFYDRPASLSFFPDDTRDYRVLTHEAIVPALSVMRASLYPNISLLYGIPSANGWSPLMPARHARYLTELTPGRLNLLNARYFVIPQLLPVDPETESYDLHDPFTPDLVGQTVDVPPTQADALELISFTSQSAGWSQGELVAEIVITDAGGSTVTLPVRAGQQTAEWAYDRSDVLKQIAHQQPPVARTWPARSGFPPHDHPGHAYRARYPLPSSMVVTQVQIVPVKPAGLFHVEELSLIGRAGRRSMADLLGLGHHRLVYRDPDVAIYDNLDALPRAFVVPRARAVDSDETALSIIDDPAFDPRAEVVLAGGTAVQSGASDSPSGTAQITSYSARRVEVQAELERPGYLALLDSYYPGWEATIDGQPATIQRADVLFRAVRLEPGRHTVVFSYDPLSLKLGGVISLVSGAGMAALGVLLVRRRLVGWRRDRAGWPAI